MNKKTIHILAVVAVGIIMAVGIHLTQEFRFYNIESNDLFLYDWNHIWTLLRTTGGLSTLLASFLTQFFRIPLAGTVILTAIYMLSAYMMYKVISKVNTGVLSEGLSLFPAVFLFLCMENDYYRFQGHLAFLLMLAVLAVYASIGKENVRFIAGMVFIPVLYHVAGSVASVFALTAAISDIILNGRKGLKSLSYVIVAGLSALVYVRTSMVSGWEHALTPFMYYDWPSTYFFPVYAWIMVPVLVVAAWLAGRWAERLSKSSIAAAAVAALAFFIAGNFYSQVHSRSYYRLIQEQYWAEKGDWDRIIRTADRRQPTYLVSYLNLALAQKGQLVQNFRYYNPQSLASIMYPTPNLKTGLTLQSSVYSAWDYHAAARQAAFDANTVTSGNCNPRQLKVLIETNIALGADDVAMKYISILRKTLFYRDTADELYERMNEPEAAAQQLPDEYVRYEGLKGDMRDILEINPSHPVLSQFYRLYQILEEEGK